MVVTAVFVIMGAAFLVIGFFSIDHTKDTVLGVRQHNARDPRYFSHAFTTLIDEAMRGYSGQGTIHLSKDEELAFAENIPFDATQFDTLVVAQQPFTSKEVRSFTKEVYAHQDATIGPNCSVRAIASNKQLIFKEDSQVVRWADAETGVITEHGCDLGISTTSGGPIILDMGCRFHRLYAPKVCVRGDRPSPPGDIDRPLLQLMSAGQLDRVNQEIQHEVTLVAANCETYASIITQSNLVIDERARVFGDVKSTKRIHIKKGAAIVGNVFADGDIVIEDGVYIGGVVFTQESVFVGSCSEIGRVGVTKSLVARDKIVLCGGVVVYGYIHCEHGGYTVTDARFTTIVKHRHPKLYKAK